MICKETKDLEEMFVVEVSSINTFHVRIYIRIYKIPLDLQTYFLLHMRQKVLRINGQEEDRSIAA